jgi:hypothetical protein
MVIDFWFDYRVVVSVRRWTPRIGFLLGRIGVVVVVEV